jgi:ribose transport system ATP-binding protein
MVLVPADRRRDGIVGSLSVTDNVTLPRLSHFVRGGILRRGELTCETTSLMDRFDVRPRDPSSPLGVLSGGNQQKAVLAKWLSMEPQLVMLDEPTQGVDVGAREQIFAVLRAAASEGASVLVASSDAEQLALLCHRVLVFHDGVATKELVGDDVSKESITDACFAVIEPTPAGLTLPDRT